MKLAGRSPIMWPPTRTGRLRVVLPLCIIIFAVASSFRRQTLVPGCLSQDHPRQRAPARLPSPRVTGSSCAPPDSIRRRDASVDVLEHRHRGAGLAHSSTSAWSSIDRVEDRHRVLLLHVKGGRRGLRSLRGPLRRPPTRSASESASTNRSEAPEVRRRSQPSLGACVQVRSSFLRMARRRLRSRRVGLTSSEVVTLGGSARQSGHRNIFDVSLDKTRKDCCGDPPTD
jgi:hypothetical protein